MGSLEKIWGMFSFNLPPICGMISSFFHRNNVCAKCALIFFQSFDICIYFA